VVVHELAHQWVGDDLSVKKWRDIWLNEGFATYAEWLWSEREGRETPQQLFNFYATAIPAEAPFWSVRIGDPGTAALLDFAVYARGAMTLHALRTRVGDEVFFGILKEWTESHAGGNVAGADFIELAGERSGQDLTAFFNTWLYTPSKPAGLNAVALNSPSPARSMPETAQFLQQRLQAAVSSR
jgi:aminopeptidase N